MLNIWIYSRKRNTSSPRKKNGTKGSILIDKWLKANMEIPLGPLALSKRDKTNWKKKKSKVKKRKKQIIT